MKTENNTKSFRDKPELLPDFLQDMMKEWRKDMRSLPNEYVVWHQIKARDRLGYLSYTYNLRVFIFEMVDDGWMDSMKVMRAVVETKSGRILDLRYHDGNQDFMVKVPDHGGQRILREEDLK